MAATAWSLCVLRLKQGLSQEELARAAGVHVLTVTAIEGGYRKNPRPKTMRGIAEALGVAIDSIKEFRLHVRHERQRAPRKDVQP